MLNAKVEDHRARASAMPEIKDQRGNSGQCTGLMVDDAALSSQLRDAAGNSASPESRGDFILHGADGEELMRRECPEFSGAAGSGWPREGIHPASKASPCTQFACGEENTEAPTIKIMSKIKIKSGRNFENEVKVQEQSEEMDPPFTQSECGGEAVQQRAEIGGQRSETILESRRDFVLQDAAGEMLMPQVCPGFGGAAGTGWPREGIPPASLRGKSAAGLSSEEIA